MTSSPQFSMMSYRLPDTLIPLRYKLRVQVDPTSDSFSGRVRVLLRPKLEPNGQTDISRIVCNIGPELKITHSQVFAIPTPPGGEASAFDLETHNNRRILDVGRTHVDLEHQMLILDLLQPVTLYASANEMILVDLVYNGVLNQEMLGLYRSKTDHGSKDNSDAILATQFESVSARRCFPCWDEPAFKAVFSTEIVTPAAYVVLSNTDEVARLGAPNSSWLVHRFADTPRMSTYLVAFIVGHLESIEAVAPVSGIRIRCWTRRGVSWAARFALDVACKTMDFYQDWFGLAYPLGKCDLVAIASGEAAAMENWGCVTFREQSLLLANDEDMDRRQWIATTVAHELAHQWFGNSTTPAWWNDLWLNEAFATYMQHVVINALFPQWNIWEKFVRGEMASALVADADVSTHPIAVDVIENPRLIDNLFDDVTYAKGASLVRMIADSLGPDLFRQAIRDYVHKFVFANATTEDLCQAFETVSPGAGISEMVKGWVHQRGYPIVRFNISPTATLDSSSKYSNNNPTLSVTGTTDDNTVFVSTTSESPSSISRLSGTVYLHLEQQSCLAVSDVALDTERWMIPIKVTICMEDGTTVSCHVLLKTSHAHVELHLAQPIKWLLLNSDRSAFARIIYNDPILHGDILDALNNQELQPRLARFILQDDMFSLCRIGVQTPGDLVELWMQYSQETSNSIGLSICNNLNQMRLLLGGARIPVEEQFSAFVRMLGKEWKRRIDTTSSNVQQLPALLSFGRPISSADEESDHSDVAEFRTSLVRLLGSCKDMETLKQLGLRFRKWKHQIASNNVLNKLPGVAVAFDMEAAIMAVRNNTDGGWAAIQQLKQDYPKCIDDASYWQLACFSLDPLVLDEVMRHCFLLPSDDPRRSIRVQHLSFYLRMICTNEASSLRFAVKFFIDHWPHLTRQFAGGMMFKNLLESFHLLSDASLTVQLHDLATAPEDTQSPETISARALVKQVVYCARANAAWVESDAAAFAQLFTEAISYQSSSV